jgi:hypothetical protein
MIRYLMLKKISFAGDLSVYWYIEMIRYLMLKKFSFAGDLSVYWYTVFMVISSADGAPQPVYED